ncbi:MAG: hypothetical protein HUU38_05455 [Anaerolineales bacterium]|nr:hypothetical protein [Anaerolineales bacterium]
MFNLKFFYRFLLGLCFAIPAALTVYATGQANALPQAELPASPENCNECHEIIRSHWGESEHGKAVSDPVFQKAWQEAGSPNECLACHTTGFDPETGTWEDDGVACATCHSPIPANHPDEDIMPTEISSRLCGTCHLQTHEEWSDSTHAQEDLSCIRCHNPHTTNLRAADTQELCSSCHNDEVHFFEFTIHAQEGVTCMDCHLQVSEVQMGEGHGARHHTFTVEMDTCSKCHTLDMHYPVSDGSATGSSDTSVSTAPMIGEEMSVVMENSLVQAEPNPASPVGYSLLAGLVGMASGMILAPWSERWFRRNNKS